MIVVIDTNILVSALWSKDGNPWAILDLLLNGKIIPCYDSRIIIEYEVVLSRSRFKFLKAEISSLINIIEAMGLSVVPVPLDVPFTDKEDKKFYEVAKYCGAKLITGNKKHFPDDPDIITAAKFLQDFYK